MSDGRSGPPLLAAWDLLRPHDLAPTLTLRELCKMFGLADCASGPLSDKVTSDGAASAVTIEA